METPVRRCGKLASAGSALSVCVSAYKTVAPSSSASKVAAARSDGTPHPWSPSTFGSEMHAPLDRHAAAAEPMPKACESVIETQAVSAGVSFRFLIASSASSSMASFVSGDVEL